MSLHESVRSGLDQLEPLDARDRAAADLALAYAQALDEGDAELDQLGPKLLAALTALQMTPAARSAALKGSAAPPTSPLDELRAKRAART
jgi:hypothetical protein